MIKFVLAEMTYLRYFMPLIIEMNKRDIPLQMLVGHNQKYNDPQKHMGMLKDLSKIHNIEMLDLNDNLCGETFITVEGVLAQNIKGRVISLVALADFKFLYDRYIDYVDKVIFPSMFMAQYYDKVSDKNLYLGSPKYDVELDGRLIRDKYGILEKDRVVTVFAPNMGEINNFDFNQMYKTFSNMGYKIITKTRGKFVTPRDKRGDLYFEDSSWYPHASMEFIEISDFIVNFDSTTIKESVMLNTPIINFNIRGDKRRMSFLYEPDFCSMLDVLFKPEDIIQVVETINNSDYRDSFSDVRDKYLFQRWSASKNIVDHLS